MNYKQHLPHLFSFYNITFMDKNPPGMHADKGENAWSRNISKIKLKSIYTNNKTWFHPTKQDFMREDNINT
jgi:hypothetical protein